MNESRVVRHLRRRKFIRAYKVLRDVAERHRADGHDVEFIAVNESHVLLMCHCCPEFASKPYPAHRATDPRPTDQIEEGNHE